MKKANSLTYAVLICASLLISCTDEPVHSKQQKPTDQMTQTTITTTIAKESANSGKIETETTSVETYEKESEETLKIETEPVTENPVEPTTEDLESEKTEQTVFEEPFYGENETPLD